MRGLKKQKTRRASAPRNRYVARAKLSEHKFLRLLHGYAEGIPIQKLEPRTHVSGKTIRSTYRTLRAHLPLAAQRDHARFANAGAYLFQGESIAPEGRKVIACIEKTRRFSHYIKRHAPRLSSCEEEHLLLLEKAVQIFCALDLRDVDVDARLLAQITEAFSALRPSEPLHKLADLVPGARPYGHPETRLYEDYRRYLMNNSLGKKIGPPPARAKSAF
ncbi:hypothetical protein [Hyphomicrobium sp. D-2]|uniref:hypothetical protein n=1 Tax=Hyphomicrobium sp. D-2 TaxID=3041621 RepID=UPI002454463A|nr:hypothetical protein [Hyphomicrobium sp. D-2]MDH4980952.1 hypothetical protein [Hyphomicrobium sp. D-2]